MSSGLFKVVSDGKLVGGFSNADVRQNIAHLFKQPLEKVQPLFSGKSVTIKTGLTQAQALQYVEALQKAGLLALMLPVTPAVPSTQPQKQSTQPAAKQVRIEDILKEFKGEVAPVKTSLGYRISISAAAFILLLIPVLYVALIIFTGYAVYYHATHSLVLFHGHGGSIWRVVLYVTPLVAGPLLILVMIKPLFANFGRAHDLMELNPNTQPHIFSFVRKICDSVKAPYPSVIRIDCEVNASASFRHGFASFFSNELVLTLGMPLLAGLNLRTLAGIIAHEFGHFSQGAAMRMTYVIYAVLSWLRMAVYREDSLDMQLTKLANSNITFLNTIAAASYWIIWLVRKILYLLLRFSEFIAQHMSRQMEFDADRYATRLIGSDRHQEIAIHVSRLAIAANSVNSQLGESWHNNKLLVEDYPGAIAAEFNSQDKKVEQEVLENIESGKTHWQDTHPCDRERIANALLEKSPGIFTLDQPAHILLTRFDKLSKEITFNHYRNIWEIPVANNHLIPVDQFIGKSKQRLANSEAIQRYFNDSYLVYCPVILTISPAQDDRAIKQDTEQWHILMQSIAVKTPAMQQLNPQYIKLFERLDMAHRADALLKSGFTIDPKEFNVPASNTKSIESWLQTSQTQFSQCLEKILDYDKLIVQRLQLIMNLSQSPVCQTALQSHETDLISLPIALQYLQRIQPIIDESRALVFANTRLHVLLSNWNPNSENSQQLYNDIEQSAALCKRHLQGMQNLTKSVPYPLKHTGNNLKLVDHLFGKDAIADYQPPQIANMTPGLIDNLYYLQWQVMGNLASLAEVCEVTLGLIKKD